MPARRLRNGVAGLPQSLALLTQAYQVLFPRTLPVLALLLAGLIFPVLIVVPSPVLSAQTTKRVLTLPERLPPMPVVVSPTETPDPDSRQLDSISRRIQGLPESSDEPTLPEGLLELMGRKPSVLKGSSLDPEIEFLPGSGRPESQKSSGEGAAESSRNRLRAAEMLLKTARLLDKLRSPSENQSRLVNQMRQEAVRLLAKPNQDQRRISSLFNAETPEGTGKNHQ